jgi:proline dehydrogenase
MTALSENDIRNHLYRTRDALKSTGKASEDKRKVEMKGKGKKRKEGKKLGPEL